MSQTDSGETVTYTLRGECERYGLPLPVDDVPVWVAFDTLMRHLYANHTVTVAALTASNDLLRERQSEGGRFVRLAIWTRHTEDWGDETIYKLPDGTEYTGQVYGESDFGGPDA